MTTSLRKNLLALAIFNAASMLAEQAPPPPAAPPPAAPADPMAPGGSAPGPEAQLASPAAAAPGAPVDELSVDSLIERLNAIRAGKSFSDPEVYGKLTTLYNQIPQEERPAIDKLMADIGVAVQPTPNAQQLAQGQPTPETAPPPAPPPAPAQQPPAPMV
jgi:hypothetical protein